MENMDWTFSLSTPVGISKKNPLRWKKQALYAGAKPVLADGTTREITEDDIDAFVENGNARLALGIKHPLPVGHTTDDEANRGWVDRFEKALDGKGRVSLYLGGTVRDEDAVKTLKSNDISIFAPREDKVGGRTWTRSIKHAALTTYPRVKDLDAFSLQLSESGPSHDLEELEIADKEQKKGFRDYLRGLRRHGMTSRDILNALERISSESLIEAISQIDIPDNRFRGDDYEAIDGAAFALAEEHGQAYLVRDEEYVLVLSEEHDEAFRVVTA